MWQLLEKEAPDVCQPRVLQLPNINSAMLKRVFNQAATGVCTDRKEGAKEGAEEGGKGIRLKCAPG